MVFVLFVSLYTSRVFLNVLGVVDYGISNVVAGFVSMFSFLNISLSNGIQRFYNSEMGRIGGEGATYVYNTSLIIQSILAIVIVLLLETFGLWYLYEKLVIPQERMDVAFWLFQFSTFTAVIVVLQTPFSAAIMAYEHMNAYAFFSIFDAVLKLIFALSLPYISYDRLLMYGAFNFLVSFLNFLMYVGYCKKHFKDLHFLRRRDKTLLKRMVSFSGWNLLDTFACVVKEQGLNMVLNFFFGPVVNAARGIAYQVSGALQGFVSNISTAARPQMVQSYATGDSLRSMKLMYAMSKLGYLILFILSIPIILNINYILHLWLGQTIPDHSPTFVALVLMASFMNNLNAPLSNLVYATGNLKKYEITMSTLNILIIPISCFVLFCGAAPEGAFVVYFVMSIVVQIGCLLVVRSTMNFSLRTYFLHLITPLLFMSAIAFVLTYSLNYLFTEGLLRVMLQFVTNATIAGGVFYLCVLNIEEKNIVNNIYNRLVKKI